MIKNIIFDLSEVIISGYHGTDKLIEKKYSIPSEEFLKRRRQTNEIFLDLMRGKMKEEEYLEDLLKGMDWNISVENMKTTIRENLNQEVEGVIDIVKKLKKNYQIILLSDHVREWMEYIEARNQTLCIFDQKIFSYEIGKIKTDEQTFRDVLKKAKILPNETIFIDDDEQNIKRARETGIYGIIFKNASQLKEELRLKYNLI